MALVNFWLSVVSSLRSCMFHYMATVVKFCHGEKKMYNCPFRSQKSRKRVNSEENGNEASNGFVLTTKIATWQLAAYHEKWWHGNVSLEIYISGNYIPSAFFGRIFFFNLGRVSGVQFSLSRHYVGFEWCDSSMQMHWLILLDEEEWICVHCQAYCVPC